MTYPVTVLTSWILASIVENIENSSLFVSDVVSKRFLKYTGPNTSSIKYTPLVRIMEFSQTTKEGGLVALVNDSTHIIAVYFTRDAILRFETRYGQRITFESLHTLMIIRDASLRFINKDNYRYFIRAFKSAPSSALKRNSLLFFEVHEIMFFLRDAHTVPKSSDDLLHFVYSDAEYQERFKANKKHRDLKKNAAKLLLNHSATSSQNDTANGYDGMLSETEDEEIGEETF